MTAGTEVARALAYAETFRPQLDAAARAVTVSDDTATAEEEERAERAAAKVADDVPF